MVGQYLESAPDEEELLDELLEDELLEDELLDEELLELALPLELLEELEEELEEEELDEEELEDVITSPPPQPLNNKKPIRVITNADFLGFLAISKFSL